MNISVAICRGQVPVEVDGAPHNVQIAWQILMHSRQQRQHKQQYDPPSGGGRDARMDPMHRGMASTPDFRLGAAADREMRQNPLLATGNPSR